MQILKKVIAFLIVLMILSSSVVFAEGPTAVNYFGLAVDADEDGQTDAALYYYNKAIELDPENWYYIKKAELYRRMNKYDLALTTIEEAIALYPENLQNYGYKGIYLRELGMYNEAVEELKRALKEEAPDPAFYYELAIAYLKLNDIKSSLDALGSYLQLRPEAKTYITDLSGLEPLFDNPGFTEMMNNTRDVLKESFSNSNCLDDPIFKGIRFTHVSNGLTKAEQREISRTDNKYRPLISGVYNDRTAEKLRIAYGSPERRSLISEGRLIKKLVLLGFTVNITPAGSETLYVGRAENGELMAAIVKEKESISVAGMFSRDIEHYFVYVKSNGAWKLYANLTPQQNNEG